jgi:MFS family permease
LQRINKTLARMKHGVVEALAEPVAGASNAGFSALFGPSLALTTIILTAAYFAHIMTFYFILKWIPKIVVDMGYQPSEAGGVLVWANVGGALGAILLGLLSQRFNVRALVIVALLGGFGLVTLFGQGQADLHELALVAGAAGFFTNAAIVGLYAMFALAYPTALRASGTGFVIGVGRGGAALGPIVGGYLFQFGFGLEVVALGMAAGSLVAAAALLFLPTRRGEPAYAETHPSASPPSA